MSSHYVIGTEVQEKSGRVKKKLSDGEMKFFKVKSRWCSRGRYVWMKENKEGLGENQRVFHINGDKKDDSPKNLVPITFSGTRYELAHSKVLWTPKVMAVKKEERKLVVA